MPTTRFQKVVFSILMSFAMVYGMEVYNSALRNGRVTGSLFLLPVGQVLLLMLTVVILETVIGGPIARKLAFKVVNPEKSRPIIVILAVQVMTVAIMCPMMSLVASLVFKCGFSHELAAVWAQTVVINFPMAFCWQIFVAGPLVRLAVKHLDGIWEDKL